MTDRRQRRIEQVIERWKKNQLGTIKKELKKAFCKLRRMQYADDEGVAECVTCNRINHYKNMHGGHFIHSTEPRMLVVENIHVQCIQCNNFAPRPAEYRLFVIANYGQSKVDELERIDKQGETWTREQMAEFLVDTQALIKVEEKRLA